MLVPAGDFQRDVILQPEFTGNVVGKFALAKSENCSRFWQEKQEQIQKFKKSVLISLLAFVWRHI